MSVRIMTRNVTRLRGFVVRIPGNQFSCDAVHSGRFWADEQNTNVYHL